MPLPAQPKLNRLLPDYKQTNMRTTIVLLALIATAVTASLYSDTLSQKCSLLSCTSSFPEQDRFRGHHSYLKHCKDKRPVNMAARFPPVPPSEQDEEQKIAHELMKAISEKSFDVSKFNITDEHGALLGPWSFMIHIPSLAPAFVATAKAILNFPHVTVRMRELAILATGYQYAAPYVLYAHRAISLSPPVSLAEDQVADAAAGRTPLRLSDDEAAVYEFALQVAGSRGIVPECVWETAEKKVARDVLKEVVGLVGGYAFSCTIMNGAGVDVPKGL